VSVVGGVVIIGGVVLWRCRARDAKLDKEEQRQFKRSHSANDLKAAMNIHNRAAQANSMQKQKSFRKAPLELGFNAPPSATFIPVSSSPAPPSASFVPAAKEPATQPQAVFVPL